MASYARSGRRVHRVIGITDIGYTARLSRLLLFSLIVIVHQVREEIIVILGREVFIVRKQFFCLRVVFEQSVPMDAIYP